MKVRVKLPGGATKTADYIGAASATGKTCLLRFGPMQAPHTFSVTNGRVDTTGQPRRVDDAIKILRGESGE